MASPVNDTYTAFSGDVIAGGRFHISGNHRISIWGQSNGLGRAERSDISASPLSADSGLSAFDSWTFSRVYIWNGSSYAKLTPASNNGCDAGQFGPEFGLAVRWERETSSGNLYIEKEAFSGVSIDYFDPTVYHYNGMKAHRTSANAWLSSNSITVTDSCWLWVQGESDASQTQSWYQTRLETLISSRSTDGFQTSTTKRILAQMHPSSLTYGAGVDSAKAVVAAASTSNTLELDLAYYMKADNIHLNGRGQVQLGYDAFEKIFNVAHIST